MTYGARPSMALAQPALLQDAVYGSMREIARRISESSRQCEDGAERGLALLLGQLDRARQKIESTPRATHEEKTPRETAQRGWVLGRVSKRALEKSHGFRGVPRRQELLAGATPHLVTSMSTTHRGFEVLGVGHRTFYIGKREARRQACPPRGFKRGRPSDRLVQEIALVPHVVRELGRAKKGE